MYVGNGSTRDFTVPFPYLDRDFVFITVNGTETGFSWVNDGMVRLPTAPTQGTQVRVYRQTPVEPIRILRDNSPNRASSYNELTSQALHVAEELGGGGSGSGGAVSSVAGKVGAVVLDTADVQGLDAALAAKASSTAVASALEAKASATAFDALRTSRGQANGIASLGADGKVPAAQLPPISVAPATYYISAFGVPADDPTGDHSAAFAALDAALAASGGGLVYIDRVCRIPAGWRLQTGNVHIKGIRGGKLISDPSPSTITLRFRDIKNVRISDLDFEKAGGHTRETDSMTLYVLNCSNIIVEGCSTLNGLTGMWFDKCSYVWTVNNRIVTPVADGIHFAVGSTDCFAIGNWVYGCGDDALACTMDYAPEHAKRISFIGNTVEYTTWGAGIALWESDNCFVSGNTISGTACAGIHVSFFDQDGYTSGRSVDNVIVGNNVLNCALAQNYLGSSTALPEMQQACGIYLAKAGRTVVKDNVVRKITVSKAAVGSVGIGLEDSSNTFIHGNTVQDIEGAGVLAKGEVIELHVGGNEFFNVRRVTVDLKTQNPTLGDRLMIYDNSCVLCSGAMGDYIRVGASLISRGAQTRIVNNRALDSGSSTGIVVDANANNLRVIEGNYPSASGGAEESSGTWTPQLRGSNGTAVGSYTSSGTWRKVGGIVFFQALFDITSVGSASGALQIANMPFPRDAPTAVVGVGNTNAYGVGGIVGVGGVANPSLLSITRVDNTNGGSALLPGTGSNIGGVYSAA